MTPDDIARMRNLVAAMPDTIQKFAELRAEPVTSAVEKNMMAGAFAIYDAVVGSVVSDLGRALDEIERLREQVGLATRTP